VEYIQKYTSAFEKANKYREKDTKFWKLKQKLNDYFTKITLLVENENNRRIIKIILTL
jgi:hypothetical protein